jgi:hypothetical protein
MAAISGGEENSMKNINNGIERNENDEKLRKKRRRKWLLSCQCENVAYHRNGGIEMTENVGVASAEKMAIENNESGVMKSGISVEMSK